MNFIEKLKKPGPILIDGAMGTLLLARLPGYRGSFELLNIEKPDIIEEIHRLYFESGSDMVETNTFGASRIKLEEYGLAKRCAEINEKAAAVAKRAAKSTGGFVGGSIGPCGRLVEPMGETSSEEVYESYLVQARGLANGGADAAIIETMSDIQEAKLALLAARDAGLPAICSMTFSENGKTLTGTDIFTAVATLAGCGAAAAGANCSMGPEGLLGIFRENFSLLERTGIPLSVWSNAGLPEMEDGKAVYRLKPEIFAATSLEFARLGVKIIGGCCGTTPDHIRALRKAVDSEKYAPRDFRTNHSFVTSRFRTLDLQSHRGTVIIGERLNPTARKKFAEDLRTGSQNFLREESKKQEKEGAHILDVNVGVPGIDEAATMRRSVTLLSNLVSVPLMIDSDNSGVIERALISYPGIPILNSVNGKEKSVAGLAPVIRRYGCFAIALCLDDTGVHREAAKRIDTGERLLSRLEKEGIDPSRIFIDPLMLAEAAEPGSAAETLKVIEHFSKKGIKTSLGLSNISFGLPQRKFINNAYFRLAVESGVTAVIINPSTMRVIDEFSDDEKFALDFLTGGDPGAQKYIARFGQKTEPEKTAAAQEKSRGILDAIYDMVVEGNPDEIGGLVKEALATEKAEDIMERALIRGLERVGELYSSGEYFLPQMISSAGAMKKGFEVVKPILSRKSSSSLGRVLICTVKGDIHDIGKNIVSMMLENHGFEVHDLGKDVSVEQIIDGAKRIKPDIICLSSLLTTTMNEMKTVRDALDRENIGSKLLIGGAVVNEEYARGIGAYYGRDAVEGVNRAKKLIGYSRE